MKTTVQTSRGPVRFHSVGKPIAEIPAYPRHEAKAQPGLCYWAEPVPGCQPPAWHVVGQMAGYPATEAHDDWFNRQSDADQIAADLARNYNPNP